MGLVGYKMAVLQTAQAQGVPPSLQGDVGLKAEFFTLSGSPSRLSDINFNATPGFTSVFERLDFLPSYAAFYGGGPTDRFAARFTGDLNVVSAGVYTLYLSSDDGSALYVDGVKIIDNDRTHGHVTKAVTLDLSAGAHDIEIRYFENTGRQSLRFEWSGPDTGGVRSVVDGEALSRGAPNAAPVARDDVLTDVTTDPDGAIRVDPAALLANDTDSDGDALTIASLKGAVIENGQIRLTAPVMDGAAHFSYTVSDGRGLYNSAGAQITTMAPPAGQSPSSGVGLKAEIFTLSAATYRLSDIDFDATPAIDGVFGQLDFMPSYDAFFFGGPTDRFGARFTGDLNVASGGRYTLYLSSDDGSALYIDGQKVIDNDLTHGHLTKAVTLDLAVGAHDIEIRYFENSGRQSLKFEWSGPDTGGARTVVDGDALSWSEPAEAARAEGLANPSLAMGLNGIADWSSQQPFIDVFKTTRSWVGHLEGRWGGWGEAELRQGDYLDEQGWPTRIPDGLTKIEAIILTGTNANATSLAGKYRVTYEGDGELNISLAKVISQKPGEIWFDFKPGGALVGIGITETDPQNTGNYIRNIQVVHESNIALHEAGAIFNPNWVSLIDDVRSVRFMDWMDTNNSVYQSFEDYPTADHYTWSKGAPLEVMVRLANEIGADPWFNMPHKADDDFIRKFAQYVHENLNPQLKAYVEYSNEVWNWRFGQAQYALAEAKARWGDSAGGGGWMQWAGMRAAQMAMIWDEVYGDDASARLNKVLGVQTSYYGLSPNVLNANAWVAEDPANNPAPYTVFDSYAVTGYFNGLGKPDQIPMVHEWLDQSLTQAQAAASANGLTESSYDAYVADHLYDYAIERAISEFVSAARQQNITDLINNKKIADSHGLDMIMYEGGTHIVGSGATQNDARIVDFFEALNYSPQMGELYQQHLEDYKALGGALFNAFVDVGGHSKYGSWGARRYLEDENQRWDALMEFNQSTEAWWEKRAPDAFQHGVTLFAGDAGETLVGTGKSDYLIGGLGDDVLVAGGGADGLHGGSGGVDTAVLPGIREEWTFIADGDAVVATRGDAISRLVSIDVVVFYNESSSEFYIDSLI